MKGGNLGFIRIIIGVFLSVLVIMIGYHLYRYNFVSIKTEDASMGEVERTIKSVGIFFRDEMIVDNEGYNYLDVVRSEGERVSANGVIARVYSNEESAMVQKEIRDIEKKIKTYEEVLAHSGSYATATQEIVQEINSNIRGIATAAQKGHSLHSFSYADELVINIMKQKIASGDLVSYDTILDGLKSELVDLRKKSEGSEKTLNSPKSGYFSLQSDGFENQMTMSQLDNLSIENFQATLDKCEEAESVDNAVGKMVYGNEWFVAMKVKSQEISSLDVKATIYIRIPGYSAERIKCTVADIRKNGDQSILILSSSVIDSNILTLRAEDIQLILESYSGIRIRHSALRKIDGQDGVFVKVGLLLRYKKVNILYNDGTYAIVEYQAIDASGIRVHDQVVYKGSNLYDGKAVS